MRERPVHLRDHEVRGILSGERTAFTRPMKTQPPAIVTRNIDLGFWRMAFPGGVFACAVRGERVDIVGPESVRWSCKPPWSPEDRLYGRESYRLDIRAPAGTRDPDWVWYRATEPDQYHCWSSSVSMPKWAARIWLCVTSVRPERHADGWFWAVSFVLETADGRRPR